GRVSPRPRVRSRSAAFQASPVRAIARPALVVLCRYYRRRDRFPGRGQRCRRGPTVRLSVPSTPLPCVGVSIIRLELSHLPSPSPSDPLRPRRVVPTRRLSAAPPAESPAVHQTFCAPVRDVGNFPLLCLCSKGASHERTVRSRHPLRGPRRH